MRTETFSTPGPLALDLRVPAGRVEAEPGSDGDSRVRRHRHEMARHSSVPRWSLVRGGGGSVGPSQPGQTRSAPETGAPTDSWSAHP